MHKLGRAASRKNAASWEWLRQAREIPTVENGFWLVDWAAIKRPEYCLYIIAPDGGWPIKIGISNWVLRRLRQLQTANWKRLSVAKCYWTTDKSAALFLEQKIIGQFRKETRWLLGEWLDVRAPEAAERLEWLALEAGILIGDSTPKDDRPYVEGVINSIWPRTVRQELEAQAHWQTLLRPWSSASHGDSSANRLDEGLTTK